MAVEGGNVMHYVKGRGNCPGEYVRGKCPDHNWSPGLFGRPTRIPHVMHYATT